MDGDRGRARPDVADGIRTPAELAQELGHIDGGAAVRAFLRRPDDGRGHFSDHRFRMPWRLTPAQPERVRERFT